MTNLIIIYKKREIWTNITLQALDMCKEPWNVDCMSMQIAKQISL